MGGESKQRLVHADGSSSSDAEAPVTGAFDKFMDSIYRHPVLIMAMAFWLMGAFLVMVYQHYGFLEAMYVITQIVTTVGYGDMTPKTDGMRLLIALYALLMLVIASFALDVLVQRVLDKEATIVRENVAKVSELADEIHGFMGELDEGGVATQTISQLLQQRPHVHALPQETRQLLNAFVIFVIFVLFGTLYYHITESCSCSYGQTKVDGCTAENVCETGQHKTFITAFYMSVVTLTTVGFGDFTPTTQMGRIIGIPWMIVGIGATGYFLSSLQDFFLKKKVTAAQRVRALTEEDFQAIDRDKSGTLDRFEFVTFMLMQEGLVEPAIIEAYQKMFRALDSAKTNSVTWERVMKFQERMDVRKNEAGVASPGYSEPALSPRP